MNFPHVVCALMVIPILQSAGRLNALRRFGLQSIGMTTNGISLHRRLPSLVANGLTHLNIR